MLDITDNQFQEEVLNSTLPVIVDFYSPTCAPCKAMMPVLQNLSERAVSVKFVKMDITTTSTYMEYGVKSLPTLIKFDQSSVIATKPGMMALPEIVRFINS